MPSMETSSTRVSSTTGSSVSCSFTRRSDRRGRTQPKLIAARRDPQGVAPGSTGRSDRLCPVTPLLHLVCPAEWRAALADGAIHPTVADFVHLSAPEQVAVAANGHYAGRTDLYLLVLDPERIPVEVRWEESEPPMRFPHAYGPVPTTAVLDVLPYPPGPDGVFVDPDAPPARPGGPRRPPDPLDRAAGRHGGRARGGRRGAAHRAGAVLLPAQRVVPGHPGGRRARSSPRPTARSSGSTTGPRPCTAPRSATRRSSWVGGAGRSTRRPG